MKQTSKLTQLFEILVMILAGILIVMNPGGSLNMTINILAVALVVYGAVLAIGYCMKKQESSIVKLLTGIISICCGIALFIGAEKVIGFFPIVAGIIIVVSGLRDLWDTLHMKTEENSYWKVALVLSLITIVLGIVICLNPAHTTNFSVLLLGIALIYEGVTSVIKYFKG